MDTREEWLASYKRAMEGRDLYAMHELEKQIFFETVDLVTRGEYTSVSGRRIVFPDSTAMESGSVLYASPLEIEEERGSYDTAYSVRNLDCLLAGRDLLEEGSSPCVLNMANQYNPGGGVHKGARAQEESIFRRSNIFRSLYQFASYAREYGIQPRPEQYPMVSGWGGVYSPDVIVFRGGRGEGYPLLDDPYALSFVTVAAVSNPELDSEGHMAAYEAEEMRRRMETVLRIAIHHGHDAVVLGAWGCGAFHNPPGDIARLFHDLLESPLYKGRFKKVVFAVLDDHNAHKRHNPEGNFMPFFREFENA